MPARKRYASELTDAQGKLLEPLVPKPKPGGHPLGYPRREIVSTVLSLTRNGCARRASARLAPSGIVFHVFWRWCQDGTW